MVKHIEEKNWTTQSGLLAKVIKFDEPPYMVHRCGYVCVPINHKLYGKHYTSLEKDLDVHGGVTFTGRIGSDDWWFGFDCNHAWDSNHPKSLGFCIAECESLANQIV